jgi:putative peptidoglycan lipid II flippase
VSLWTLVSRITGLVRELLVASTFGASAMTDAFNVAFRIPNLFRRLFAEGAFSQAFVPVLAASKAQHGEEATRGLIDKVATVLAWVLVATCVLGVVLAPLLVWAMASGLQKTPNGYHAAVVMTRFMFPYIGFMSMVALASGILNTWKRFAVPAATPVLLNVAMISAAWLLSPWFKSQGIEPIYAMGVGVMVGGILQLALQVPVLKRMGLLPTLAWRWSGVKVAWRDAQTRRIATLMVPALLGVSANLIADQYPNSLPLAHRQRELAHLCGPFDGVSYRLAGRGAGGGVDADVGLCQSFGRCQAILVFAGLGAADCGVAIGALCDWLAGVFPTIGRGVVPLRSFY